MDTTETLDIGTPTHLRDQVARARVRRDHARITRPRAEGLEVRTTHIIIEWDRLAVAGTVERQPNLRVVTTIARVLPKPGSVVRLRPTGYEGHLHAQDDEWTVMSIGAAEDGVSNVIRLQRVGVLPG
jgi:hypothetical protein